jgi:excisionase family DNA binding protein
LKGQQGCKAMKDTEIAEPTSETYCGTKSAAILLGLSVGTIQNLVEAKKLYAWKTEGGHRRISMKSIIEYQNTNGIQDFSRSASNFVYQVIIVEDDENTVKMLEAYFERWKFPLELMIYPSAMYALLDWHLLNPVILLTDLMMPNINGFDFIRTIRQKKKNQSMPIVAITGLSDGEIKSNGGLPDDILILKKPLDMEWLKGFLQGFLAFNDMESKNGKGKGELN